MFSVVCLALILTATLITKISFSRTVKLTQLSLYPYYVIFTYMLFEATEIMMIITEFNKVQK